MYIIVHMKDGTKILSRTQDDSLRNTVSKWEQIYLDNVLDINDREFRKLVKISQYPEDFPKIFAREEKMDKGILISREHVVGIQFIG